MDNASRFHGPACRALRKRSGIPQADLARRVGISPSHLANIEKGTGKQPSLAVAVSIAAELDVDLEALTYCTAPREAVA